MDIFEKYDWIAMTKHSADGRPIPLFAYGTLTDPAARRAEVGREVNAEKAVLHGYGTTQIMIGGSEYPAAFPSRGSRLHGVLLSLTMQEIRILDEYETDAYSRVLVTLDDGKTAWAYVLADNPHVILNVEDNPSR